MARVLLAEDEFLIRMVLAEELAEQGHVVIEASSGDEAMRIVDAGEVCDILVTDIQMPGTLDGIGLATQLRTRQPGTPVVYVTGRPESLAAIKTLERYDAIIRKPFAAAEIVTVVRDILAHAEGPMAGW